MEKCQVGSGVTSELKEEGEKKKNSSGLDSRAGGQTDQISKSDYVTKRNA